MLDVHALLSLLLELRPFFCSIDFFPCLSSAPLTQLLLSIFPLLQLGAWALGPWTAQLLAEKQPCVSGKQSFALLRFYLVARRVLEQRRAAAGNCVACL